jgi:hypothetical protein
MAFPKVIWEIICTNLENGPLIWYFIVNDQIVDEDHFMKLAESSIYRSLRSECFGEAMEEFRSVLIESGGIVAGSFPARSLMGKIELETDIDIFVPVENSQQRRIRRMLRQASLVQSPVYCPLLEWMHSWDRSIGQANEKGYDWQDLVYVYSSHIIRHGSKAIMDEIEKQKNRWNHEGRALVETTRQVSDSCTESDIIELFKFHFSKSAAPMTQISKPEQRRRLQIIVVNVESSELFNWIVQNSDINLFKTCWDGKDVKFGSMIPVMESWHKQKQMPHHTSLSEVMHALLHDERHFRFRRTPRSLQRMYSFLSDYQPSWHYDRDGLWKSLLEVGRIAGRETEYFKSFDPRTSDKLCKCCDQNCILNKIRDHVHDQQNYWGPTVTYFQND